MESILIGDTEVLVGRDLPSPLLPPRSARTRVAILTQPGAASIAQRVADLVDAEGVASWIHVFPDRDEAKSLAALEKVYSDLANRELGRGDTVVAVGGGAVTDAGGFVAATWMRGVELINIPTTLLGAVDAAIGGKTAVNLAGKNLVGAFWSPSRIIVDLEVLDALPTELRREGAAEIIKAGLLSDPRLVDLYIEHGLETPAADVVPGAVRVKASIVSRDPTEKGERALLNLGHTIGHAVEFASGISHGDAVSLGTVAAMAISETRFGFQRTSYVRDALASVGLPLKSPVALDREEVLRLMARDKKRAGDSIRMVLLEDVASPHVVEVSVDEVAAGLDAIGL